MKSLFPTLLSCFLFLAVFSFNQNNVKAQCDSTSWVHQDSGDFNDVHFTDSKHGWAITGSGKIKRTTNGGQTWETKLNNSSYYFNDVEFVDSATGWAVGTNYATDLILHTSNGGETWTNQSLGTLRAIQTVNFINSDTGWVAGSGGIFKRTTNGGQTWEDQSFGETPTSIQFINDSTGWLSTSNGEVFYSTNFGKTWNSKFNEPSQLNDIHFINANQGWVAGDSGTIYYTPDGGNSWKNQSFPTNEDLNSVHFTDSKNGWIAGNNGTFLKTINSGNKWLPITFSTYYSLNSVHFKAPGLGWLAGSNEILAKSNGFILKSLDTTSCIKYTVPSGDETYATSGIYYDTLPVANGCDTLLKINYNKEYITKTIDTIFCQSYTTPSGNQTYTSPGTYYDTLTNQYGCDSIIEIDLDPKVDTTVFQQANTLQTKMQDANYQWLQCNQGQYSPIAGAVNQVYEANSKGSYAVEVTYDGCSDTSSCHKVTDVAAITNTASNHSLALYPNPASQELQLSWKSNRIDGIKKVIIQNLQGQTVQQRMVHNAFAPSPVTVNVNNLSRGIYFVKVQTLNGENYIMQFLKE